MSQREPERARVSWTASQNIKIRYFLSRHVKIRYFLSRNVKIRVMSRKNGIYIALRADSAFYAALLTNNNKMRTWMLPLIFLVGKIFSGIFCAFPKNHLLMVWVDKSFIIASEKPASNNVGFLRYIQAHCTKD